MQYVTIFDHVLMALDCTCNSYKCAAIFLFHHRHYYLNFLVRKLEFFRKTRPLTRLLMPQVFVLPGHQQPENWLFLYKLILVFHEEGFKQPTFYQCREIIENANMILAMELCLICINSLGPSDAIWCWRSWSTLVQVMACCLTAPSYYLNQCWLIISKVLWHSSEDIVIRRFEDTNQ